MITGICDPAEISSVIALNLEIWLEVNVPRHKNRLLKKNQTIPKTIDDNCINNYELWGSMFY